MKRFLIIAFTLLAAKLCAQTRTVDYIYVSDYVVTSSNNSVQCLHLFYKDLLEFKAKGPEKFRFRYYESYNCVAQPKPAVFDRVKNGTDAFYKPIAAELWQLYNDSYAKGGEIVAYVRLEDYKTNLDHGFELVRDLMALHTKIAAARKKIADHISASAKTLPSVNSTVKAYQAMVGAIVHEEILVQQLSFNLHDAVHTGLSREAIQKSFLETDDLLQQLKPEKFTLAPQAKSYFKACYEGLQQLQRSKANAMDDFNYITSVDGLYSNEEYAQLLNYFNNDLLAFFLEFYGEIQTVSAGMMYYPVALKKSIIETTGRPWANQNTAYAFPALDSVKETKETVVLPVSTFTQLSAIVQYIDDCVANLDNLYNELRSEESTWRSLRQGKMPYKNPFIKFDHFKIPYSSYALLVKYNKNFSPAYRPSLAARVDDLQNIMLALQDHTSALSQYMSTGAFREKGMPFIEEELQTIQKLYEAFDQRKEKLYYEARKVHQAYLPNKKNSWITASTALLKATDDSRAVLRKAEKRLLQNDPSEISTTALHDDQRDLIINELKYMNGITRIGKNNGMCPYNPYEYIPDYLNTLGEKIQKLSGEVRDKKEAYRGILYMHNSIVEQYNKFAELGMGGTEYSANDPMRPVYILPHVLQMMKYYYEPPAPEEKPKEIIPEPEAPKEVTVEEITFEGYPVNNLVLLLDVSSSMDKPDRLPLLKKDFQRLVRYMRTEDEVSIVIYSGKAALLLPPTSARDTVTIVRAIEKLRSDGKTNVADGMNLAYKTARKNFKAEGNNRIILATDGEFNTGESLYALAEKNAMDIPLTIFDFSQKVEPIKSIQSLAERGKGNYVKVTSENSLEALVKEARKVN